MMSAAAAVSNASRESSEFEFVSSGSGGSQTLSNTSPSTSTARTTNKASNPDSALTVSTSVTVKIDPNFSKLISLFTVFIWLKTTRNVSNQ